MKFWNPYERGIIIQFVSMTGHFFYSLHNNWCRTSSIKRDRYPKCWLNGNFSSCQGAIMFESESWPENCLRKYLRRTASFSRFLFCIVFLLHALLEVFSGYLFGLQSEDCMISLDVAIILENPMVTNVPTVPHRISPVGCANHRVAQPTIGPDAIATMTIHSYDSTPHQLYCFWSHVHFNKPLSTQKCNMRKL